MPLPFPTLDFSNIVARYPKAVEKVKEWLFSNKELQEQLEQQVEATNYPIEELKTHFTGTLIQMDPRKLYDIFDALGITVLVWNTDDRWRYSAGFGLNYASTRHEAETSAFHDAFEVLENQENGNG